MPTRLPIFCAVAATLLAATAAAAQPPLFVSPAGQVFRAGGEGAAPIERWFAGADADHDGTLNYAEFRADFERAFALFDRDRDGEIEPDEVAHYETEIFPEMASRGGGRGARPVGGPVGGREGNWDSRLGATNRPGRRGRPGAMMSGAARFGLLPMAHPLWDADEDFNRGVSRAEWERASGRRFVALDAAHNGRLRLADLAAQRPGGPDRP